MTKKLSPPLPTVLTISGSDCSAGAGLQADLKTIHALGGYALTVPTAITAQNSLGVSTVYPLPAHIVRAQLQTLMADYDIQAIKIGMLGSLEVLETVIQSLKNYQNNPTIKNSTPESPLLSKLNSPCPPPIVLDPVLISSSGKPLLEPTALPVFINKLLPLTTLITPNIPEVNALLKRTEHTEFKGEEKEIPDMAQALLKLNLNAAVIKGGHTIDPQATDYLIQHTPSRTDQNQAKEIDIQTYSTERVHTQNTHGTGCTYASAIATELAKGHPLNQAIQHAKDYLFSTLIHADNAQPSYQSTPKPPQIRKGGLNHFKSNE
ncbi:Hydroxymethylpyrimidine phosphate kinase ThiD [hydrothermal vent metagenome]|uniref:Hydroxymethylpyrimidine phosphate kinase ThiD n=1 Tax=hydrothermal vent metagenome TaxID=652676 RepID=A0A3B0WAZ1_9ZZZZ